LLHMLLPLIALSVAEAATFGSVDIDGIGEVFVVAPDWAGVYLEVSENGFTLSGGGTMHFAKQSAQELDPENYLQMDLREKYFNYTLDISKVECGCNGAGYFTDMPGPSQGSGEDWYCDANYVGGQWCPEYDTLESNKYVMAATLHSCKGEEGNWMDCDRAGCQANSYLADATMLGPGDEFTINTEKSFQVSHYQDQTQAIVYLSQDGKSAEFEICTDDASYHEKMAGVYPSMVFTASLWGGGGINMSWLDGITGCEENCNINTNSVTFSDFALTSIRLP